MARLAALTVGLSLLGGLAAGADAQAYPRLHVAQFAQRADRSTVEPSGVFHLTIHVKIVQRRERLDELILGSFENCEIISNETVRTALPDGTDFVERLTIQALAPGEATISPAYIDADDPALGKPMRFSSNAVRVQVLGVAPLEGVVQSLAATARRALLAAAIVAGLFATVFVLSVLFIRRRRRPATVVVAPIPVKTVPHAPQPATSTNEPLLRAADVYRSERSEASLATVRGVLFTLAGVAAGATLVDALRALGAREPELRSALLAAEAAAFGPGAERVIVGDRMLAAIQAYVQRRSTNEDAWTR